MSCYTEELIEEALKQIVEDVANGDITAIEELLQNVSAPSLAAFLSEEKAVELKSKWNVAQVDWVGQ